METGNEDQRMLSAPAGAEDVILDRKDGQWFVAVRLEQAHPNFTHERLDGGYTDRLDALNAAYDLAVGQDLSIAPDPAMGCRFSDAFDSPTDEQLEMMLADPEHWDEH
jgi:hypothetical protein